VRRVRTLGFSLVALAVLAAVSSASASAEVKEPDWSWAKYRHCPVYEMNGEEKCSFSATKAGEGGHYTVGTITVEITKQIALQGGLGPEEEVNGENIKKLVAPTDGTPPIEPTPETVPGEVLGNVTEAEMNEAGWPQSLRESYAKAQRKHLFKEGKTTEVIEAAGKDQDIVSTYNLLLEEGPTIVANVQISGRNPWLAELGGSCQIGSEANPIVQHLQSGTSISPLNGEALVGKAGFAETHDRNEQVRTYETKLVDNTYPVPGAEKCGGAENEAYLDPIVDKAFGIPAPAGASSTVLEGSLYQATRDSVLNHYF
jgi:hypothetical protein